MGTSTIPAVIKSSLSFPLWILQHGHPQLEIVNMGLESALALSNSLARKEAVGKPIVKNRMENPSLTGKKFSFREVHSSVTSKVDRSRE